MAPLIATVCSSINTPFAATFPMVRPGFEPGTP
jgi:hypothetical protein